MCKARVSVVVLGDVGRSPRMQYHSLSLAREGYLVDVIGYQGSEPIKELTEHPSVVFKYVSPPPDFQRHCPRMIGYVLKVLWQVLTLSWSLFFKSRSDFVLVQNPPAIPTLAVSWLYCLILRSIFIIDWHNYGYTILALTLRKEHVLVKICKWFESWFGCKAHANFCVTKAMKDDLKLKYGIIATTLYDRPPEYFRPIPVIESHNLFTKLTDEYEDFGCGDTDKTVFTEVNDEGLSVWREKRPGLLVSSTSWTEDEDFSVLLSALNNYEDACSENVANYPRLLCVITGKGPLKEHYINLIQKAQWKNIKVITPWLHPSDYPLLLASADLGVCLHTSSSGLDLPMKVVDMFGCGLPVCAYNFPCLHELIAHKRNSYVFTSSDELASQIQSWFRDFPNNISQKEIVKNFKLELQKYQSLRWHENWMLHALPQFK